MNKWLSGILRVVAAAGIAALGLWISGITLSDRVLVPPGAAGFQDLSLTEPTPFAVVEGDLEATEGTITLRVADGDRRQVAARRLGVGDDDLQPQPGLWRMFATSNPWLLLLGLAVILPLYPIAALRWWVLMHSRGIDVSRWRAFKVSMVGNFFSFCLPGTTGGDLVKAYYAARHSDRRADTIVSILADRALGLSGMVVLAGCVGVFMLHVDAMRRLMLFLGMGAAALALGATLYFHPWFRRVTGFEGLIRRLPSKGILAKIDEASVAYRHHKAALLTALGLSVCIHALIVTSTAIAGYALGMRVGFGILLTVVPILFMAAAVPLAYQGMGIREPLATALILDPPAATANHIAGMLLLVTIYQIVCALGGIVFLVKGDVHLRTRPGPPPDDAPS